MNSLSSVHQLWAGIPATPLTPGNPAAPSSSIPAAELRELTAGESMGLGSGVQPTGASFSSLLGNLVQGVNAKQNAAAQALQDLQGGQNVSLHQTMITMEEASVSFQLMVEVRNRLLDSYQELMRMQV